jgi:TorA maturation chaperone TorD
MTTTTEPQVERNLAGARAVVYGFVRAVLDKPTQEQHRWMTSRAFRAALEELAGSFGVTVPPGLPVAADFADYEAAYIATFDVGVPIPPVVLLASHYNRREPVPAVIYEHLLFYRRFKTRSPCDGEPADHVLHELTFLIRLDELLAAWLVAPASLRRARRDFLRRQVSPWVGRAAADAAEKDVPGVYAAVLALLAAAVEQDLELTQRQIAEEPA